MRGLPVLLFLSAMLVALPAAAQVARPASAPAARVTDEAALSERVRREASNPLRIILEASKIRRRPGEPETDNPSAAPVNTRLPAVRTVATTLATTSATTAAPPAAAPAAAPVAPPAATTPPVREAEAVLATMASIPASRPALPTSELTTVPPTWTPAPLVAVPLQATVVPAPVSVPAPAPVPPPQAAAGQAGAPRLLNTVMPDIPAAAMRRAGSPTEVTMQVTIERDGRISRASLVGSPGARAIESYVVEALLQWRYAPLPEPVTQRLQLVFAN